jgi:hypothetical protein
MPKTRISGWSIIVDASMMPFRMVVVTWPPARNAPANSNIAAITMACFMVIALEPTDVPIALATSLAPMPQVMKNPKAMAMPINMTPYWASISID